MLVGQSGLNLFYPTNAEFYIDLHIVAWIRPFVLINAFLGIESVHALYIKGFSMHQLTPNSHEEELNVLCGIPFSFSLCMWSLPSKIGNRYSLKALFLPEKNSGSIPVHLELLEREAGTLCSSHMRKCFYSWFQIQRNLQCKRIIWHLA